MRHKDWDKAYNGQITSVVDLRENPNYSLYNIELDEATWDVQENIKGKYITAIDKEDIDECKNS